MPFYIELSSLNDFGRFVCALERSPMPSFSMALNRTHVLAVQTDFFSNIPIYYYVKFGEPNYSNQYLAYRCSGFSETVTLVETAANPLYVYSPIINIVKLPLEMTRSSRSSKKLYYKKILLRDLSSLAKIAAYKTIYDEPPLPIFTFKNQNNTYTIGTPVNVLDNDTLVYFYYLNINVQPYNFLKYSSQKTEDPIFTNSIEDHGYIYMKIIKLQKVHPLVIYDE